jgi:osmotically-inducible protein OsmY
MVVAVRSDALARVGAVVAPRASALEVGMPVLATDGWIVGWIDRLLTDADEAAPHALVVRTGRFFGARRVVPAAWVASVDGSAATLSAARADLIHLPEYRSDAQVRSAVLADLGDDDPIRALGLRAAAVEVDERVVTLRGHVPSRLMATRMVEIAARARGVLRVVDELVADDALESAVAQAISRAPLNRGSRLRIRSDRGHVRVGGVFASRDAHDEAVRAATTVEGVVAAARSS